MIIAAKLEGAASTASTDAIDRFSADETPAEYAAAIQRDIDAGRPEAALGSVDTYRSHGTIAAGVTMAR